jgi:hypothetical protein
MELINECSMRFAEDKDFRLLVSFFAFMPLAESHSCDRLWIVSWLYFESISQEEGS